MSHRRKLFTFLVCKNLYKDGGLNLGSAGRYRFFSFEYPLMPSLSSFIFRGKHPAAFPFCPQNEGFVSSAFFPASFPMAEEKFAVSALTGTQ